MARAVLSPGAAELDAATYTFTAPDGSAASLTDLFDGHRQLVIYHFMLEPGEDQICGGCATFTDNLDSQSQPHLNARHTRLILMARAPQPEIEVLRRRFGWSVPWYSSYGTSFNDDMGLTGFGLSVLLRDGDEVFRSYFTTGRGVDRRAWTSTCSTSPRTAGKNSGRTPPRAGRRARRCPGFACMTSTDRKGTR